MVSVKITISPILSLIYYYFLRCVTSRKRIIFILFVFQDGAGSRRLFVIAAAIMITPESPDAVNFTRGGVRGTIMIDGQYRLYMTPL